MTATRGALSPPNYNLTWRDRLYGSVLFTLCEVARYSGRFSETGWPLVMEEHAAGRPVLFATWHANSMMLVAYMRRWIRNQKITAIMPDDWRGGALMHWLGAAGITPWPMDLENKGVQTARRLVELVRFIKKEKYDTYVSPDGPEGPSRVIKPGATYLAQKTGALMIPIAAACRPGYTVNRWDGYRIPLPFSRIHVAVAPGIPVGPKADLKAADETLRRALNDVQLQALDELYSHAIPPLKKPYSV